MASSSRSTTRRTGTYTDCPIAFSSRPRRVGVGSAEGLGGHPSRLVQGPDNEGKAVVLGAPTQEEAQPAALVVVQVALGGRRFPWCQMRRQLLTAWPVTPSRVPIRASDTWPCSKQSSRPEEVWSIRPTPPFLANEEENRPSKNGNPNNNPDKDCMSSHRATQKTPCKKRSQDQEDGRAN